MKAAVSTSIGSAAGTREARRAVRAAGLNVTSGPRMIPMETDCSHPLLAVDAIVRIEDRIVLVHRRNPPEGWAIPGGFVEYGETVEEAVRRELREETGLGLESLSQWRVFSDPARDPRRHVISLCFTARGHGSLRAASDADEVDLFPANPPFPDLAFDHRDILLRYARERGD